MGMEQELYMFYLPQLSSMRLLKHSSNVKRVLCFPTSRHQYMVVWLLGNGVHPFQLLGINKTNQSMLLLVLPFLKQPVVSQIFPSSGNMAHLREKSKS